MKRHITNRTKECRNLAFLFGFISAACYFGVAIFAVITCFTTVAGHEKSGLDIISDTFKTKLISLSLTMIVGIIISIVIKEKLRLAVYMLSLIIVSLVYKEKGMYSILAIWAFDEYVLAYLYKRYKNLAVINKEIDLRE